MIPSVPGGHSELSTGATEYLKAIYELEEDGQGVTTGVMAHRLKVAPASVTGMLRKLAATQPRLVNYTRYRGATLTPAGRKIALAAIRRQRLIELYLVRVLGYDWDQVSGEAGQLETVMSAELADKLAALLSDPTADPHGDPIPSKDGQVAAPSRLTLSAARAGQQVNVTRVPDDDPSLLRYLAGLGIRPQARLTVIEIAPFDGPLTVTVGGQTFALGRNVADKIHVTVEEA